MRYSANTIDDMQKLLIGYRDNMRVEIETDVALTAKTVADLRVGEVCPLIYTATAHLQRRVDFPTVSIESKPYSVWSK